MAVFFPAAEFLVTTRFTEVAGHQFKTEGKVMTNPGWLAVYGKDSDGRRQGRRQPGAGGQGRKGADREGQRQRPGHQAARTLQRSDAAVGDGRRRQAGRFRRAARRHGRQGPGHAGHARGHHRRPADREIPAARRPRDDPDRQGVPADDAAARPGRERTDRAGTDRRVGIQAVADGEGPDLARRVHARDRRDDRRSSSSAPRNTTTTRSRASTRP